MGERYIPYGRQWVDADDMEAVAEVMGGEWLTTGPNVERFEQQLARAAGARCAVALNSGTAALHSAYRAVGVGPKTEVVVPALTFSATANAATYLGATVRFADICEQTLTVDPASVKRLVNERTAAVVAVDFAGHSADMDAVAQVADGGEAAVVQDAAHSLGGAYRGQPVGSVADITTFSFHPVKAVTTGEGGAAVTDDERWAESMRRFRNHGMHGSDEDGAPWSYDIDEIGYNYRITDLQCALGSSQLEKLERFVERRRQIAARYRTNLAELEDVELPPQSAWCDHAYHLFVIRVPAGRRRQIFEGLRQEGIGVQLHYIPVNVLSAYQQRGHDPRDTPVAWREYRRMISIPCYPKMTDGEVEYVVEALRRVVGGHR